MKSEHQLALGIVAIIAFVVCMGFAAMLGIERAKAGLINCIHESPALTSKQEDL